MNFNDEIINIEILDEEDMIDIEVSDDHLFYGDEILVSNSIGIPGVVDMLLAAMRNEETDALGQIIFKQLKNRFRKMQYKPKFILGCEFDQQLFYDISNSEQTLAEGTPYAHIDPQDIKSKFERNRQQKYRGCDDIIVDEEYS